MQVPEGQTHSYQKKRRKHWASRGSAASRAERRIPPMEKKEREERPSAARWVGQAEDERVREKGPAAGTPRASSGEKKRHKSQTQPFGLWRSLREFCRPPLWSLEGRFSRATRGYLPVGRLPCPGSSIHYPPQRLWKGGGNGN